MGKRKKATKPPPKAKDPTLEKTFDCPFCGQEQSVDSSINRKKGLGRVACRSCKATHVMSVNTLTEAVDIFADWIDRSVEANQEKQDV
mmetsp:Transcript_20784/g.30189  ORF Transcript_20784/g.30189 Transcript_20784/m.30189 type:complete len:88 (+) Transcript_20784:116-379(+)